MASATKKNVQRRGRNHAKAGHKRKRLARNKGTTPKFPIHKK